MQEGEEQLEVNVPDPTLDVEQETEGDWAGPKVSEETKPAEAKGEVEQETEGTQAGPKVPKQRQQSELMKK